MGFEMPSNEQAPALTPEVSLVTPLERGVSEDQESMGAIENVVSGLMTGPLAKDFLPEDLERINQQMSDPEKKQKMLNGIKILQSQGWRLVWAVMATLATGCGAPPLQAASIPKPAGITMSNIKVEVAPAQPSATKLDVVQQAEQDKLLGWEKSDVDIENLVIVDGTGQPVDGGDVKVYSDRQASQQGFMGDLLIDSTGHIASQSSLKAGHYYFEITYLDTAGGKFVTKKVACDKK